MPNERFFTELDIEPKIQVSGESSWRNVDVTGNLEYYPNAWVDLTTEMTLGRTHQVDGLNTIEFTPRLGLRVHFLKQVISYAKSGKVPGQSQNEKKHRVLGRVPLDKFDIAVFVRLEHRNFWYSDDRDSEHSWRLRGRLESKASLNNRGLGEKGVVYGIADVEQYFPLGDEITERFPNKTRIRIGLGYRFRVNQQIDVLYIRDWHRDSADGEETEDGNSFDVRWKVKF
jgi:hypothetical protein